MKIGGEKIRNASGQQGENEQQWKKANRNTSNKTFGVHINEQHFLHKMCNYGVSRRSRAKDHQKNQVRKKVCCFFLLLFSLPSPFSITRFYFFVWVNYKYINENFAFSPGFIVIYFKKICQRTIRIWRQFMINLQNSLQEHFHTLWILYSSLKWITKLVSWRIKTHDIHVL